jgi:uncharacterized protein HemX
MNDTSDTASRIPPESGADGAGASGRSPQVTAQQGSSRPQGPAIRGDATADGPAGVGRSVPVGPPRRGFPLIATMLALGFALLAAGALWFAQDRVGRIERDLARRLQDTEIRSQQLEQQLKLLSDTLRDAQGRAAVLEAKLSDSLGQQSQLRQLYDEIARTRGDLMLADVENSIMIAAQQLQLGGNVNSALLALQDADQVLARSNQSAMIGLRRVLTRDIERLKGVPLADFAAAVNRLDAVIGGVEKMSLLADVSPVDPSPVALRGEAPPDGLRGLPQRVARTGLQGWDAFVAELRQLVRVQRLDQPDVLLLSPDQRFFARENLRLQLLNARLNLLARNESLFRADLARATRAIERWFDPQQRVTASAIASLAQLQGAPLSIELPSLAESIGAVRAARAASDAR